MLVDHIFIFSTENGKEADELIKQGFVEGPSRVHPGQGTVNRKFLVENFFLEILWVHNHNEIDQPVFKDIGLYDRAYFEKFSCSRFGLCIVNTKATDEIFEDAIFYQPKYFSEGKPIEVVRTATNAQAPWTFRLPYRDYQPEYKNNLQEKLQIEKLTRVNFILKEYDLPENLEKLNQHEISFSIGVENKLELIFDHSRQGKIFECISLPLIINY
ncbi:hypothetical protein GCM10009117_13070 [Gangjinia marincola]|uniref:Glyoxalase-like domain-containing protein n=1 Tax=Gangjinia marincola TaxID=578463 RepID=A0ABN1MG58_9FLAO